MLFTERRPPRVAAISATPIPHVLEHSIKETSAVSRMSRDFDAQLAAFGPESHWPPFTLETAQKFCRQLGTGHYENFLVASFLLPKAIRQDIHTIYAYCRWADDLADEFESSDESLRLLDWWEKELDGCLGDPQHPVFIALGELVRRRDLPTTPFHDLLVAFRRDQQTTRYETVDDLLEYCRYSANPVGQIILHLGDCWTEQNAINSDQICTALQLVNLWQDISRDFRIGRIYLPRESMAEFGVSIESFPMTSATPQFRRMLESLVTQAESMFDGGELLRTHLPNWLRTDVELFVAGGRAVIDAIRAQDHDVWTRRPVVGKRRKLMLLSAAVTRHWRRRLFGGERA